MSFDPATALIDLGGKLLDKFVADPGERDKAKLELLRQSQSGELDTMRTQLSAIISDSQSQDKWTSRARPSFLYVVYVLLLWSIPMGILYAYKPEVAANFTTGFANWMRALPDPILTLFGVVMTGYVAGRSWEKVKGAA
jgi:hypothetical protein